MFTGIIETIGTVKEIRSVGKNKVIWIDSDISAECHADQSVNHNGICLTIETTLANSHRVTAIAETIKKTTLSSWKTGDKINLERCLKPDGRLDGHLVQGHVDAVGECLKIKEKEGSVEYDFGFPAAFAKLIIEKGSISVNGISLTAFNVKKKKFSVAIIPYTFEHTNFRFLKKTDKVNLEFDVIGKYVLRSKQLDK